MTDPRSARLLAIKDALSRGYYGREPDEDIVWLIEQLDCVLVRAAQPPAGAEAVREAFTAGFLAHIDQKTATQAVVLEQPYDWRFDGSPAADLEPQAWAAWTAPAQPQKEPR